MVNPKKTIIRVGLLKTESTSFKIKKKSLFKNGNKIINTIKNKKNN
jgi:hypothetical protein